jgi:hypothetical protein
LFLTCTGEKGYEAKLPNEKTLNFTFKSSPDAKEYLANYKKALLAVRIPEGKDMTFLTFMQAGLTREVDLTAIAVWDTVGTLGLPVQPFFQRLGFPTTLHKYRFFDSGINKRVKNAFHALSLDERRSAFQATVWEKEPDNNVTVGYFGHLFATADLSAELTPGMVRWCPQQHRWRLR